MGLVLDILDNEVPKRIAAAEKVRQAGIAAEAPLIRVGSDALVGQCRSWAEDHCANHRNAR